MMRHWAEELDRLREAHRLRALLPAQGVDFTSNDYLGLARHPVLKAALLDALAGDAPLGAGGSRLLRGHHPAHESLEARAAQFFGAERALYFANGFMANYALFSTLAERHDAIVLDEYVHASVMDGAHAAPAKRYKARHNDVQSFADAITRARQNGARGVFVAVESLYSMDGDFAPLDALAALAREHDAVLVVDEAHATGVFGKDGRGLSHAVPSKNLIALHTCGKALGVSGALVTGPATLIDMLVNKARPFIYSTAPPQCIAAATERALMLLVEEPERRARLLANVESAKRDFIGMGNGAHALFSGAQIVPVILGEDARAVRVAKAVRDRGFDVRAIRPPTVPAGTARLRICLHADHTADEIAALGAALRETT